MQNSRLVAVALSAAGLASGAAVAFGGGDGRVAARADRQGPGAFLVQTIRQKVDGRWGQAWRSLYPLHRRVAPLEEFVRCETATPFPAELRSLRVVGVRSTLVSIPGLAEPIRGAAVTVEVELLRRGIRDPFTFRHTFHVVLVTGGWTWLLSPSRYRLYRDDACAPPPAA